MRRATTLCLIALACLRLAAQDLPEVSIVPAQPRPGDDVTVTIVLSGVEAAAVSMPAPELEGPLSFVSSSVRPMMETAESGVGPRVVASMVLKALAPGQGAIRNLSVSINQARSILGSYVVDIAAPPAPSQPDRAGGRWIAPDRVWAFEPFVLKAVSSSGAALDLTGLSIPSLVLEATDSPGAYLAVATKAGSLLLPAWQARDGDVSFRMDQRVLDVDPLPPGADLTRAVGAFTVSLALSELPPKPVMGDRVAFEALISGTGSIPWAAPPAVWVLDPEGHKLPVQALSSVEARALGASWAGSVFARGSFLLTMKGRYRIGVEPYQWLDPASGGLRQARATELSLDVGEPKLPDWKPTDGEYGLLVSLTLFSRDDEELIEEGWFEPYGSAAWDTLAEGLSGSTSPRALLARAAALALAGRRAEALAQAAWLERGFWPPAGAAALTDMMAASLDVQPQRDRLPPPGWACALALTGTLGALAALCFPKPGARNRRGGVKAPLVALAALSLAALSLAGAAWLERRGLRVVSLGAAVRSAPSELADMVAVSRPGATGTLRAGGDGWYFVRFADGSSGWLRSSCARSY